MQLNSTEISELIKKRIAQFDVVSEARNTGTIVSVSDGIISCSRFKRCDARRNGSPYQATVTQWHLTLNVILLVR